MMSPGRHSAFQAAATALRSVDTSVPARERRLKCSVVVSGVEVPTKLAEPVCRVQRGPQRIQHLPNDDHIAEELRDRCQALAAVPYHERGSGVLGQVAAQRGQRTGPMTAEPLDRLAG